MKRFVNIGENYWVNIDHLVSIHITDVGNAFDKPFRIQIFNSHKKNEWTFNSFHKLHEAEDALDDLLEKLEEVNL